MGFLGTRSLWFDLVAYLLLLRLFWGLLFFLFDFNDCSFRRFFMFCCFVCIEVVVSPRAVWVAKVSWNDS